jgi:tetratricopeptide (TPR) repeat protein
MHVIFPSGPRWHSATVLATALACCCCHATAQDPSPAADEVETAIVERLADDPDSAVNWRLLSRLKLARGDVAGAIEAAENAVAHDAWSASAHFDLGQAYRRAGRVDEAAARFYECRELAPESEYDALAETALRDLGRDLTAPPRESQADRFAGAASAAIHAPFWSEQPIAATFEFGTVYNSNVQLAPINRLVIEPGLASPQGYLAGDVVWWSWLDDTRRFGWRLRGYFNVNESGLDSYNLQEYQPGIVFERRMLDTWSDWYVRGQYDFALDQFSGQTLATRHATVWSLNEVGAAADTSYYWGMDSANYSDDGLVPSLDSLDGWTHTLGASRTWYPVERFWQLIRWGGDLQWAPLEGSDFAYRGAYGYVQSEAPVGFDSVVALQFGLGLRDYPDFSVAPSRDETLYRVRVECRRPLSEYWEIIATASYDRFACANEQFDTQRLLAGVIAVFRY